MKISDLSTDKAMDVLCEITPPISEILSDDELVEELGKKMKFGEAVTKFAIYRAGAEKICNMIPIILNKKRAEVYTIVAVINGMHVDDVKKQNIMMTCSQIRDIVMDKAFMDFAKSWVQTEKSE